MARWTWSGSSWPCRAAAGGPAAARGPGRAEPSSKRRPWCRRASSPRAQLPELLYEVKRPLAGDLAQQLAWMRAIKRPSRREVERLVKRLPAAGDLAGWLALAPDVFAVAPRAGRRRARFFARAQAGGPSWTDFLEAARWQALAGIAKALPANARRARPVGQANGPAVRHRTSALPHRIRHRAAGHGRHGPGPAGHARPGGRPRDGARLGAGRSGRSVRLRTAA